MKISKINSIVISALQLPIIYKAFTDKESKENKLVHGNRGCHSEEGKTVDIE